MRRRLVLIAWLAAALHAAPAPAAEAPEEAFRTANRHARSGDLPRAIEGYAALAAEGHDGASLYWNWSQAAELRGTLGEALWALLRAREREPGDPAIERELERLREIAGLEPAELAPEPLAALGRRARRYRLGLLALLVLAGSVLAHAALRLGVTWRGLPALSGTLLGLGLLLATPAWVAGLATPTAVVAEAGVPLLDAASPTAEPVATLREGEVVLVLEESAGYLQVQDSSGARGWADAERVRRLEAVPSS